MRKEIYSLLLGIAILFVVFFVLPTIVKLGLVSFLAGWQIYSLSRYIVESLMGEIQ